jgi:hypothetical protein
MKYLYELEMRLEVFFIFIILRESVSTLRDKNSLRQNKKNYAILATVSWKITKDLPMTTRGN